MYVRYSFRSLVIFITETTLKYSCLKMSIPRTPAIHFNPYVHNKKYTSCFSGLDDYSPPMICSWLMIIRYKTLC